MKKENELFEIEFDKQFIFFFHFINLKTMFEQTGRKWFKKQKIFRILHFKDLILSKFVQSMKSKLKWNLRQM